LKSILIGALALTLAAGSVATAQPYGYGDGNGRGHGRGDHSDRGDRAGNGRHAGWGDDKGAGHRWSRGQRMGYNEWSNARAVDYRRHLLRAPPRGYEWRESNGQYVLAAVATGLIMSIILNNGR
jgi:Ni/Co efflux regulator RcnB